MATINLDSGGALVFADSSAVDWTGGTLNITGTYVSGSSLKFGTTAAALTPTQLGLLTVNGAGGPFTLDSNGFLTGSAGGGSAYSTWASTNAPLPQTPGGDFDGDGVSNAVEFVLGGLATTNDLGKLPMTATSGGNMTFTFRRAQSSIDPKTSTTIEVGTDLATWNTAPSPYIVTDGALANNPGVTVVKDSPTAGTDTITLTVPQTPDAKKFARLKVVITP